MDKPIQMAIGVGLAIAAMAIVGVYVFGVIGGSTASTDIVPKTLDVISSNQGKSLQLSVSLTNQGSGSISSVGSVLRVDVRDSCGSVTGPSKVICNDVMKDPAPGVIYFPISHSTDVVESFGTINIRTSIESVGIKKVPPGDGCKDELDSTVKVLVPQAGFTTLDDAIEFFDADDRKITVDATNDGNNGVTVTSTETPTKTTVGANNVLCVRDFGVFAGEEVILTIVARTTSGDIIERIIPLTVR